MAVITNPGEHLFKHKHNKIKNLNWSSAGHTFDTTLDVGSYGLITTGAIVANDLYVNASGILQNISTDSITASGTISAENNLYISSDTLGVNPTITLYAAGEPHTVTIELLSVSAEGEDSLRFNGGTPGAPFTFFMNSADTKGLSIALGNDGGSGYVEFTESLETRLGNNVSNGDILLHANRGGTTTKITWDVSEDKLIHSAGTFNFDNDNLVTTGYIMGNGASVLQSISTTGITASGTITAVGNILPEASGARSVGTQATAFSEGNFGTVRADTGYITDLYVSSDTIYIGGTTLSASDGKISFEDAKVDTIDASGDITASGSITASGIGGYFVPNSVDDTSAPNNSIYYSTASGVLVYKDSIGTVYTLY